MGDARDQIAFLIKNKLVAVETAGSALASACLGSWPRPPVPRGSVRHITSSLGLAFAYTSVETEKRASPNKKQWDGDRSSIALFRRSRKLAAKSVPLGWRSLRREADTAKMLCEDCKSPRHAVRLLARLDAFEKWLIDRRAGVEQAAANLKADQEVWSENLNSRLAILELSGNTYYQSSIPVLSGWPETIKTIIRHNRLVDCTKWIRNTYGYGLMDAKNVAEQAMRAYVAYGEVVLNTAAYSPVWYAPISLY